MYMTKLKKPVKGTPKPQKQDVLEQLQRLQAEFENYKKREEKEREAFMRFATSQVLGQLIPIMDNFELALQNVPAAQKDGLYTGVELIYAQLKELLQNHGVVEIPAEGQFNPEKHEAMLAEDAKAKKGTILEVMQKGYEMNGKVIRTSKVKVAR